MHRLPYQQTSLRDADEKLMGTFNDFFRLLSDPLANWTIIYCSQDLRLISEADYNQLYAKLIEVKKMLAGLIRKVKADR